MGADRNVNGIKRIPHSADITDRTDIRMIHLGTQRQYSINIFLQTFSGQTVAGNTIPKHSAQILSLFEDGCLMPHQLQIVRCRKAGGTAADNGNLLARGSRLRRRINLAAVIHCIPLETANIDR